MVRRAHLTKDTVQPLKGTVQMKLYPAGRACHCLTPVFGAPALDKADSNSAHVSKRVDRLEAIVDTLFQQCRKVLIIEDFQIATWWNFTDRSRMPVVHVVTVGRLDEDCAVTQTLGKNLASNVVESNTVANVPASEFNLVSPINVTEEAETEAVLARGVGKAVNGETGRSTVEGVADSRIRLVVVH